MSLNLSSTFDTGADLVFFEGYTIDLLYRIPDSFIQLIITSPPYNLGKPYESKLETTFSSSSNKSHFDRLRLKICFPRKP